MNENNDVVVVDLKGIQDPDERKFLAEISVEGVDLDEVCCCRFFFTQIQRKRDLEPIQAEVAKHGLQLCDLPDMFGANPSKSKAKRHRWTWSLRLWADVMPTQAATLREAMEVVAEEYGAKYDGWEGCWYQSAPGVLAGRTSSEVRKLTKEQYAAIKNNLHAVQGGSSYTIRHAMPEPE